MTNRNSASGTAQALDAKLNGGNAFTGGSQVLAPSTTTYSSMNVPVNGAAPSTPNLGDVWLTTNDNHVQFQDKNNATQAIAYLSDITSGTVTVSGNISESQVTGLPTDLSNLTASVSTETGRATAAESTISGSLTAETRAQQARKATLTTSLGNEVTRATAAEACANVTASIATAQTAAETFATGAAATAQSNAAGYTDSSIATEVTNRNSAIGTAQALDAKLNGGNAFTGGSQVLAPSAAGYASMNLTAGAVPSIASDRRSVAGHRRGQPHPVC